VVVVLVLVMVVVVVEIFYSAPVPLQAMTCPAFIVFFFSEDYIGFQNNRVFTR
jgi:hypothetical protein